MSRYDKEPKSNFYCEKKIYIYLILVLYSYYCVLLPFLSLCFFYHVSPVGCLLSEWSPWGECSASCGGGLAVRNKTVLQEPEPSGDPCVGPLEQHIVCNTNSCLPGKHKHTRLSHKRSSEQLSGKAQVFASACRVSQWPGVQRLLRSLSLRVCRPVDAHPVSACSLHTRVHLPTWTGLDP